MEPEPDCVNPPFDPWERFYAMLDSSQKLHERRGNRMPDDFYVEGLMAFANVYSKRMAEQIIRNWRARKKQQTVEGAVEGTWQ